MKPELKDRRKLQQLRRDAIRAGEIPPPIDTSNMSKEMFWAKPKQLEYRIRAILPKGKALGHYFNGVATKTYPSATIALAEARRHARVAIADLPVWWAELVVEDDHGAG